MDWASLAMKGFALLGMGTFVFYVGKLGLKPVFAKIVGAFGTAKADFAALEARVGQVETQLGIVKPTVAPVPAAPDPPAIAAPKAA